MQRARGTALLFITHNLGVVARSAERASVLYAGKIVESTDVATLFARARPPLYAGVIAATPRYDRPDESLAPVRPEVVEALRREIEETDRAWREAARAGRGRR